jgi:predicted MFS family arabinose efflux permease
VAAYSIVVTTVGFLAPLLLAMANDLGVSPTEVGQLVVFTALPWGLIAPFCGLLSDRLGRRPVLLAALAGMGLSTIAGAFASELRMLIVLRILTGAFGSGGPPTIMAGLVEYYPAWQRGRVIGWINTSFSLAALVGVPLIGAVGGAWGWRASFLVVGLGLLVAAFLLWLCYPRAAPGPSGAGNPLQAYRYLFGRPHLATLLLSNLFERVAFMVVTLYLPSFLIRSYGLDPVTVAPALVLTALGALAGGVAGGVVADRFDRVRLAAATLALSGLCGLAAFLWPLHPAFSVATGFGFGLLDAAGRPAFTALLLGLAERHRGAINGLYALSNQLGWAVGAGLGGLLLGLAGYGGLGETALAFTLGAAVLVLLARSVARPPPALAAAPASAAEPR